jgi:hypothetical protein
MPLVILQYLYSLQIKGIKKKYFWFDNASLIPKLYVALTGRAVMNEDL